MANYTLEKLAEALQSKEPDEIAEMLLSPLKRERPWGGDRGSHDMWFQKTRNMVAVVACALCELRDRGLLNLTPQVFRENLHLGLGMDPNLLDKNPENNRVVSAEALQALRLQTGMIALYLRALNGEMSDKTRRALLIFFDTLPAFSLDAALAGKPQSMMTSDVAGYMTMAVTKHLGNMIDERELT